MPRRSTFALLVHCMDDEVGDGDFGFNSFWLFVGSLPYGM